MVSCGVENALERTWRSWEGRLRIGLMGKGDLIAAF